MQQSLRHKPRTPGYIYSALVLAMLMVIGLLTLTARQPPPPTIAEFAPQALEQITEAPSEQSSEFGSAGGGSGGGLGGSGSGPDSVVSPPIDVPRVRRCVGDPPRQIEDPQSPPCVPYWEGNNGGSTYKGVTADEIRIAFPHGNAAQDQVLPLQDFFNKRFEFYGRKLNLRVMGGAFAFNPEDEIALAVEADEQEHVFGSTFLTTNGGFYYHAELARRGIVSAFGVESSLEQEDLRSMSPYVWSYVMSGDKMLANIGEWMCKRLAGQNATHSGDAQGRKRVFGLVLRPWQEQDKTSLEPLEAALAGCGEKFEATFLYPPDDDQSRRNLLLDMQTKKITSILCLCQYFYFGALTRAADEQVYFPEWLATSFSLGDANRAYNHRVPYAPSPQQLSHLFGVTFKPRQLALDNEPFWWALREANPDAAPVFNTSNDVWGALHFYRNLLLLASGIQMAGPKLNPQTFEKALHRTVFPNPPHPNMEGKVSFLGGSYDMTIDGAEWWWSNTGRSPYSGDPPGSICYVDRGARHRAGQWPRGGGPFFSGECDSGAK